MWRRGSASELLRRSQAVVQARVLSLKPGALVSWTRSALGVFPSPWLLTLFRMVFLRMQDSPDFSGFEDTMPCFPDWPVTLCVIQAILNSWSSWLSLARAGIVGMSHCTWCGSSIQSMMYAKKFYNGRGTEDRLGRVWTWHENLFLKFIIFIELCIFSSPFPFSCDPHTPHLLRRACLFLFSM